MPHQWPTNDEENPKYEMPKSNDVFVGKSPDFRLALRRKAGDFRYQTWFLPSSLVGHSSFGEVGGAFVIALPYRPVDITLIAP